MQWNFKCFHSIKETWVCEGWVAKKDWTKARPKLNRQTIKSYSSIPSICDS